MAPGRTDRIPSDRAAAIIEAGTPQPEPQQPASAGPPSEPPAGEEGPTRVWRALSVVLALALGFAAAVMVGVMVDVGSAPRCDDPAAIAEEREETGELVIECFEGSQVQKTASLVLGWPAGAIAGIAALIALFFAARGRHDQLMIRLTAVALVLGGLSILVGSI